MTDDHVRLKIKEAIATADGDRHDAQKLLITWAVRDPQLLLGMTKPHLKAIAAALIEHAARPKSEGGKADNGPDNFTRTAIDDIVASASGRRTGDKRNVNVPPPKSTERQASTMRKLAAAFTKKPRK
ncbi:MAG TPA: hypothetical protein VFR09_06470 [Alphaproteobacteria bacterium]|nr:hypothetical protein [Alphaproteobacteria bacterium]